MTLAYRDIFFDLDRTLWDFDQNSDRVLREIFHEFALHAIGITEENAFVQTYQAINESLWIAYRNGTIMKRQLRKQRFSETLSRLGVEDHKLGEKLDGHYLARSPIQTGLMPNTIEVLEYLASKYRLHIISNGFTDVQYLKIKSSGLKPFFKVILTSEKARTRKPDVEMFQLAMRLAKASPSESLMIGDDLEIDIIGAKSAGMDQVYFNPSSNLHDVEVSYEVKSLIELIKLL